MLLKTIYYILFVITFIYGLYFVITGVLGLLKRNKKEEININKYNHFAILIAARNEAATIGNLLESLNNLEYPKDKYDIYVIPNNCTDNTKEVSKKHNANIIDCNINIKTKADVLRLAFNKLKKNTKIDAYVIFDADNVVDKEFLIHMNHSLNNGYQVAEGFRDAKNPHDNWISGSYSLFYLYQNVFFNYARKSLNLSTSINGTGFMVKKDLIDTVGFNTKTLTEDVEFTGLCALNNVKIDFVEKAITYDEYPISFNSSWRQRKRWSSGAIECMTLYTPRLFINFLKTGNISSLDISLVYLGPLFQILSFINMILLIILKYLGIELNDILSYFYASGLVGILISYLLSIAIEVFIIKFKHKKILPVISSVLLFSLFILTWLPINILCFIKKETKWEEIKHNRNVKITEISK